ncbi:class III extradiol ring-cleavage dioxygenase family protein [Nocardia heshunensis]
MFCVASLVPSPPVLVPELEGAAGAAADTEVAALRAAVLSAAGELAARASRWIVIGVAEPEEISGTTEANRLIGSDAVGTFRGYGVDVRVGLTGSVTDTAVADPLLPLPALIAGWLREQVAPEASAECRLISADASAADCSTFGRHLRAELDAESEPVAVLVVGDGAATLSLKAPRYLDERAEAVQADIDRALSAGDRAAIAALDTGLCGEIAVEGRAAYQVLAGLFTADPVDPEVETLYAAAPFGVAYHVSVWRPGAAR